MAAPSFLSMKSLSTACGAVALIALLSSACEPAGEAKTFVERLGDDTTAVESYVRTASGFEGEAVVRSPITQVARYSATLAEDGTVRRLEVSWSTPPENPEGRPPYSVTYTISGDSATIDVRGQDTTTATMAVPPGAIPLVGVPPWSYAVFEQATTQAMGGGVDSMPIHFVSPRGRINASFFRRLGPDSVSLDYFGSPMIARVDEQGHIQHRSGARTTMKTEGALAADANLEALAADFAARDARGEGLGVASPRDTVEAVVDGANVMVEYSRPAMRGRAIWGALVPFGEVWRTGANAATHFTTDRDLQFGETTVPAGTYTLFSIYTADAAELIINRQTGQWGTVYDEDQDLARIAMQSESLAEPLERFTFDIQDTEAGGVIQLEWNRTRYVLPFRVR